jgi:cell division protein FtsL
MPSSSIIFLGGIIAAFVLFAVVLAWVDHQTRNLSRREEELPPQKDRQEIQSAV